MPVSRKSLLLATILVLSTAVCLCSAPAPGAKIPITTHSDQARESFLKGRELNDNLRITDANPLFKKAVEADTNFALGYLFVAQTASSGKEFFAALDKAVAHINSASEGERLWILGTQAGAFTRTEEQHKAFAKLVDLFPDDERARLLLGVYFFGLQDYPNAIEQLHRAIELAPNFAPAYNQLGYAYRFTRRFTEAEETFRKYTELIPDDPNPYDSFAELLLKMGRFDEAIAQYEKALAVDIHFSNSYSGIAAALMYQGKHAEALALLEKAETLARTDAELRAASFWKAVVQTDRGNYDAAVKEMERQYAVAKRTGDAAGMAGDLAALATILLEKGDADGALREFGKSRDELQTSGFPDQVKENAGLVYLYNAGRAEVARHNPATASKFAEKFQKGTELKKNPVQIRFAHELNGMIALEKKQYKTAIAEFEQANLQNPQNLFRLAKALQESGDKARAKDVMAQAAKFNGLPALNYAFIRMRAENELAKM
jgi:tetratricopeptide (TPR) repeat protein